MSRPVVILLFVGLIAALVVSAFYARHGFSELDQLRVELHALDREAAVLAEQREQVERRREIEQAATDLLDRAESLGLQSGRWTERRLRYRSSTMPRRDVLAALDETVPEDRRALFVPRAWTVGVSDPGFSLFSVPSQRERGLNFELTGTLYLQVEEDV
ncbi:hypothetical protein IC757_14340 [Wenzhouxiangella sp. AB-CW3]|uniref:hypothetical protein n=1 Tax=Wenzhouxiangella sp. AB-CW3 TaxID=2771012 RepID=UPI00168B6D97|nr:hypothetical protein [Wenzhouxiangella sp. AB-CW3]QOC22181.1 hypothetical protein IC757_14340 [Wenzhouxiangella sp. AB-CW3]